MALRLKKLPKPLAGLITTADSKSAPTPGATVTVKATPSKLALHGDRGMNRWERQYAERLEGDRLNGTILSWTYQPLKLRLADLTFYTPDFMVILQDGTLEMHEVKGFMRDDAAVKIKVAAELFPFIFRLATKEKTLGWVIRII